MDNKEVERIKTYMKNNKITYEDLAAKANMSIGTIKSIFSGRTPNPRIDTLRIIKDALGLDEKKPLADEIVEQVAELNIADYQNLSEDEKKKIAEIFNATVSAFKKK